jgi:peptidoglycan/xylan/chitin deacetylase (PgdA/CDA1 family)
MVDPGFRLVRRARLMILVALGLGLIAPFGALANPGGESGGHWEPVGATVFGTEGVRLRSCPSLSCEVSVVAKLGERLLVTGPVERGFSPVDYGGAIGYAYDLFLAKDGQAAPFLKEGPAGCKRIALIFNIGIGETPVLSILDALVADEVAATVFVMGWWAAANPDLLSRIDAAGFAIGSHGDQRVELTDLSDQQIVQDITDASAAIASVLGRAPEPWFTPYANAADDRVRRLIGQLGSMPVGWEVPAADFDRKATSQSVYDRVMPNAYDGAIVEFHLDGPNSASSTAVALPWIVEELRAQGYTFVTIPELAQPCASA